MLYSLAQWLTDMYSWVQGGTVKLIVVLRYAVRYRGVQCSELQFGGRDLHYCAVMYNLVQWCTLCALMYTVCTGVQCRAVMNKDGQWWTMCALHTLYITLCSDVQYVAKMYRVVQWYSRLCSDVQGCAVIWSVVPWCTMLLSVIKWCAVMFKVVHWCKKLCRNSKC